MICHNDAFASNWLKKVATVNNWQKENYLSLCTRKRDGSRVATPVWFANEGGTFYVFSEGKAGKVKRIRNFSDVTITPCTVTGKLTGEEEQGQAVIIQSGDEIRKAHQLLVDKYGWQMRLLDFFSWLGGKKSKRAFIRITLP